jgi:hypothetical protein
MKDCPECGSATEMVEDRLSSMTMSSYHNRYLSCVECNWNER